MSTSTAALCDTPPAGGGSVPHVTPRRSPSSAASAAAGCEVGAVGVGVGAALAGRARRRWCCRSPARHRALEVRRAAVADEVGDGSHGRAAARGRRRTSERSRRARPPPCRPRRRGSSCRSRPVSAAAAPTRAAGRELDEVVAARRDRSGQRGRLPASCRSRMRTAPSSRSTSTAVDPRLKSSTKSFENGAPALPPPAKTWLTTTSGEAPRADGATKAPATARSAEEDEGQGSVHVRLQSGGDEDSFPDTVLSTQAKGPGAQLAQSWHTSRQEAPPADRADAGSAT